MPRMPMSGAKGLRAFIRSLPKLWGRNAQHTSFQKYFITCLPLKVFLAPLHNCLRHAAYRMNVIRGLLTLAVLLPVGELSSLEDTYWQGYLDARRVGQVPNLMAYVTHLATPVSFETGEQLRQRKHALTYFIATGGKNGFSDKKATPEQVKEWHKAYTFVALMQEAFDPNTPLNIMEVRRRLAALKKTSS